MDYWIDGLSEAFDEIGIVATPEQIRFVAEAVEGAHQNYGMAHGYECIPNPLQEENERLGRELEKEHDKVICPDCEGKSGLISRGPLHVGYAECWKCGNSGRV